MHFRHFAATVRIIKQLEPFSANIFIVLICSSRIRAYEIQQRKNVQTLRLSMCGVFGKEIEEALK